jgi:hypothetical protein
MLAQRRWTTEDDQSLREANDAGKQPILIGKELRRSQSAIIQRIAILKKREK